MPPAPLYRVVLKVYEPAPPTFFSFTLGTTVAKKWFCVPLRSTPPVTDSVVYDTTVWVLSFQTMSEVPFVVPYAHEPLPVGMGSWYFAPATLMIAPALGPSV